MKTFKVKDNKSAFALKAPAMKQVKRLEGLIDSFFAAVQNEGTVLTTDDLRQLNVLMDEFVETYENIDTCLHEVAEIIIAGEVKNDK